MCLTFYSCILSLSCFLVSDTNLGDQAKLSAEKSFKGIETSLSEIASVKREQPSITLTRGVNAVFLHNRVKSSAGIYDSDFIKLATVVSHE